MNQKIKKLSLIVLKEIEERKITSKKELNKRKRILCEELGVKDIVKDPVILSFANEKNKSSVINVLQKKPVRTLSGICSIAIMAKPHDCPGKCIYCPNSLVDEDTPKSYTGKEPATMRALNAEYDAYTQVKGRINQLQEAGHNTGKIELIIMGGTFPSLEKSYQREFMKNALTAISGKEKNHYTSLENAKKDAEKSFNRVIGTTFETRADYCKKENINDFLELGGTRVELGVQTPNNEIYRKINRGHSVEDVVESTQLLKDSSFKVGYHLMPGLPFYKDYKEQLKELKKIFTEPEFKPDMLKIYPCLVIKGTRLYEMWKNKEYNPLTNDEAVKFIAELKSVVPNWARIMRIQRDIPSELIEAGVKASNLRQLVHDYMKKHYMECNCIRCREVGLKNYMNGKEKNKNTENEIEQTRKTKLCIDSYKASNGQEIFLSIKDSDNLLYGFCRMRIPYNPFRKEITEKTALIREMHVYGEAMPLHETSGKSSQHKGFGKSLLEKAEEIAKNEFDKDKILVISGLGVKEYYRGLGYSNDGPYVSKKL